MSRSREAALKGRALVTGSAKANARASAKASAIRTIELPKEVLQGIPAELAGLLAGRRRDLARVRANETITTEYRDRLVREIEARSKDTFEQLRVKAETYYADLMEAISEAEVPEEGDTDKALLAEMKLQRNWSRYQALLDGGVAPEILIGRAGDEGEESVRALVAELPSYLEANSYQADQVAAVQAALTREEEPYLSAEERLGRESREEASAGWGRIGIAFVHTSGELDGTFTDARGTLPGWDGTEVFVGADTTKETA